jgi:AraC-like DNA-binding protein
MHEFSLREQTYSPGLRQQRHAHEYSNITIVLAGKIEEATELGEYCAFAGSVVSKGAGCEHEDRVGGHGAKTLSIRFPNSSPLQAGSWSWLDTPDVVRCALAVHRGGAGAVAALIAVVEANQPRVARPVWIDQVITAIDRDFERSICFSDLARDFGLHPVYAARAFRAHVGMSMREYVRAVRVRHARVALSSTRRSVAAIAAQCGFADSSHLCRTFTRSLGTTPRRYRNITG